MKMRAIFFILAGSLASLGGVAFAATGGIEATGGTSLSMIATLVFSGLSQLGSTGYLIKTYADRVDKIGEAVKQIPVLVETIEAHKEAMIQHAATEKAVLETHEKNMTELYGSRNDHAIAIAEINKLHKLKKCEEMIGQRCEA